jgi:hypothetical protein
MRKRIVSNVTWETSEPLPAGLLFSLLCHVICTPSPSLGQETKRDPIPLCCLDQIVRTCHPALGFLMCHGRFGAPSFLLHVFPCRAFRWIRPFISSSHSVSLDLVICPQFILLSFLDFVATCGLCSCCYRLLEGDTCKYKRN